MTVRKSVAMLSLLATAATLVGCQPQTTTYSQVTPPSFKSPAITPQQQLPKFTPQPQVAVSGLASWVPAAKPRKWIWIILHHTATPSGSLRKIDHDHKARGFDDAGYDFVIGNGTETGNGTIEVGPRWRAQRVGAHTQDPSGRNRYNEGGIGIVFVGNFDVVRPTPEQVNSSAKLVAYLMKTYKIPASRVLAHRDCKPTDCPGKYFPLAAVKRAATQQLAAAGESIPEDTTVAAGTELLRPLPAD